MRIPEEKQRLAPELRTGVSRKLDHSTPGVAMRLKWPAAARR